MLVCVYYFDRILLTTAVWRITKFTGLQMSSSLDKLHDERLQYFYILGFSYVY